MRYAAIFSSAVWQAVLMVLGIEATLSSPFIQK